MSAIPGHLAALCAAFLGLGIGVVQGVATAAPGDVDFAAEILPILDARCFRCHGPDKQKSGLRLDTRAAALAGSDFGETRVIVPGDGAASVLWQRVAHEDEDERMPPSGAALTASELGLLRDWIDGGAHWPDDVAGEEGVAQHWAYVGPVRPEVSAAELGQPGVGNAIDVFVARRRGTLPANPPADPATLVRRLCLDLTGLPPSLEQVAAFEADPSDEAYARLVEELLASPHYGEHQASAWLDQARYADSDGYEKDARRTMWRWRDWVIDAFNADMPFDRFTIEQLAGDLLPDPSTEQLIATGFHRNTMVNLEGGVDPEEFRVAAVVDRVDTTATVWLGSSLGCARCHDHKFDSFAQREYYELFAFFNQSADDGSSDAPKIEASTAELDDQIARVTARIEALDATLSTWTPQLDEELGRFIEVWRDGAGWRAPRPGRVDSQNGSQFTVLEDGSVLAEGAAPETDTYSVELPLPNDMGTLTGVRIEVLADPSLPESGPGRAGNGNFVLSEVGLEHVAVDGDVTTLVAASARADHSQHTQPSWLASDAIDGDATTGWAIGGGVGSSHQLVIALGESPGEVGGAEGGARPGGTLRVTLGQEYGGAHVIGRFRIGVTDRAVADRIGIAPPAVERLLALEPGELSDEQRESVHEWFLAQASSLEGPRNQRAMLVVPTVPTALVMQTREEPRETRVMERGSFLSPGELVSAGVPAVMPALETRGGTRLDLARWLVSRNHPLTARVTVNRIWARIFGTGIVATEDDFGTQGERPSHPELLDWLATSFRSDWSVKRLLATIVTSHTYRQSAAASPEAWRDDPFNRLLARGPRQRVAGETVRDIALAASGLLSTTIGGPSVFPPQPEGTWAMTYSGERWKTSTEADRHRRGLYTFWRRTAPYPTFMLFDAPSRELVCTRRDRTNTPLQALATLNDPAFVECAVALARRMLEWDPSGIQSAEILPSESPRATDVQRIERGFRWCVARSPSAADTEVLLTLLDEQRASYSADPEAAAALSSWHADGPRAAAVELAAWTLVANVLLNMDETVTKG